MARPTKYRPEYSIQAEKLLKLGAIEEVLADFFEVSQSTITLWKKNEEFSAALKRGKGYADAEVANSLYKRAMGYEHPEVDLKQYEGEIIRTDIIKHYPPDTTACIFWLKNRQPDTWRDRTELTGANGEPIKFQNIDLSKIPLQGLERIANGESIKKVHADYSEAFIRRN